MHAIYLSYVTLLGVAVGSFLNVVVFRYHTGRSIRGRSFCPSCAHKLAWYDLFPVMSFALLRGKCRYCRTKISWQYPLIELVTGALYFCATRAFFAQTFSFESIVHFALLLVVLPLLVAIFAYDIRHKIIPDGLVYAFSLSSLTASLAFAAYHGFPSSFLTDIAAGPILFLPFFLLWYCSGGKWIGFGDAKLALGMGWMLGLSGGVSAVLFGFWSGALFGLGFIAFNKMLNVRKAYGKVTMKSEVPFAPFLIFGVVAVEFFGFSVFMFGF